MMEKIVSTVVGIAIAVVLCIPQFVSAEADNCVDCEALLNSLLAGEVDFMAPSSKGVAADGGIWADYGDAPDEPFPTKFSKNGACSMLPIYLYMGGVGDLEDDGQPTGNADGDDTNGIDDEDGVEFLGSSSYTDPNEDPGSIGVDFSPPYKKGTWGAVEIKIRLVAPITQGYVNAWIDWAGNDNWDDTRDQVIENERVETDGDKRYTFYIPAGDRLQAPLYARFRVTRNFLLNSEDFPGYKACDCFGEVEDYKLDSEIPVGLSSFSGRAAQSGIQLEWITQSETENLGFHILRSRSEDGKYERITAELIAGAGSSWKPQSYRFVDEDVKPETTYYYKVQDVDFAGKTILHGPVEVRMAKPAIQKSTWGKIKSFLSMLISPFVSDKDKA